MMGIQTFERLAEHEPLDLSQCQHFDDCKITPMLQKQTKLWDQHLEGRTSNDPLIQAGAEKAKSSAEELGKMMRVTLSQCHFNAIVATKVPQKKPICKI